MELIFTLNTIHEAVAAVLKHIGNKRVVALYGEMGAGKTTFAHAFCETLEVVDPVSSPTFSIINTYTTSNGVAVYHLDLYRLNSVEEAFSAGVEEVLYSGCYCLVEWPEKALEIFPEDTVALYLEAINAQERRLRIVEA